MTTNNGTVVEAPPTALARREEQPIEPTNMRELRELAKDAAESRFFGCKTQQEAVMLMMAGRDLGLSYTQALRAFHVIQGRPALSADGMVAVCLSHRDICEYVRVVEATDDSATVVTKRVGDPERRQTFTVEDAKRAGLVKSNGGWTAYPGRMVLARAKAFLMREVYPDLLMGLYDPDELRDIPERKFVRAEALPVPPASKPAVDEGPTAAAAAFADVCAKASTVEELRETGRAIADANLSDTDKAHVKAAYEARRRELKAGAK